MVQTDEERKAKKKKYDLEYRTRPAVKAKKKLNTQTPEYKARRKEYRNRPENKEKQKIQQKTYYQQEEVYERVKKRNREYYQRPEVNERVKKYRKTPKAKAKRKIYRDKPEIKLKEKKKRDEKRLKILQVFSKRLSNSDIPCCRCCGLNSHVDFLAIDHIAGKKEMDSEPELEDIEYDSEFTTWDLQQWIIDNNYLSNLKTEYFQILCHNCNHAKGHSKNNKCPLENKPH
jgi:hypothetical protein